MDQRGCSRAAEKWAAFGQDDVGAGPGGSHRRCKSGAAAADNENVAFDHEGLEH